MEDQRLTDIAQAQEAARAEIAKFLGDMKVGDNGPVDILIAFRCPDGQTGFWSTPGATLVQLGMLELVKGALLAQAGVGAQQVRTAEGVH